jgi:RNA polymerase nonessential primary-like sigma factor
VSRQPVAFGGDLGASTVIERRFGLNGQEAFTLGELAVQLDLTRERVRQIQLEALAQLRRILSRRGLSRDELL